MRRFLPDEFVGACAGFVLGFLASTNLALLGVDVTGWPVVGFGLLGALVGSLIGAGFQSPVARARAVARWCVAGMVAVGGVAFVVGFVGPMLLHPDWPQGPMLGFFCTGPLGAVAGANLGAVVGLLVPMSFSLGGKSPPSPAITNVADR